MRATPTRSLPRTVAFAAAVTLVAASVVHAQTNEEIGAGIQFSFAPPGARSLAMGSAFSGLADDATAAFANPAGLIWLTRSEVSIEGRHRTYTTRYPFSGSASGAPTGLGIDTVPDVELRDFDSDVAGVSFLSYAHVFGERKPRLSRLRLAFHRHELATYEARLASEGAFIRDAGDGPPIEQQRNRARLAALMGDLDLTVIGHGASAAYSVTDNLWLGAGLSYYTFDFDAVTRRFATELPARDDFGVILPDGRSNVVLGPADFSDANESERSYQDGDDGELAGTIGLIWKSGGSVRAGEPINWSIGLVYRQGPSFDLDYRFQYEDQRIALREETGNQNFTDPAVERALTGRTRFEVPDVVSLGFMFRPSLVPDNALTVSFEVAHVGYSSLKPEANLIATALRGLSEDGRDLAGPTCGEYDRRGNRYPFGGETRSEVPCLSPFIDSFRVEDAEEFHLGVEYLFDRKQAFALRAGAWYDPDHQLAYDFGGRDPNDSQPEDRFGLRFAEGEDEFHWTGGFGVVFSRLQIDFAFDLSGRADVFSLSSVYRFR
ncbi:MAG: hypothetical protein GY719_38250 [bacterium]|nr:hypothetical protein [bacterium]